MSDLMEEAELGGATPPTQDEVVTKTIAETSARSSPVPSDTNSEWLSVCPDLFEGFYLMYAQCVVHLLPPCGALIAAMRCTYCRRAVHLLPPCGALLPPCGALIATIGCTYCHRAVHLLPPLGALIATVG